MAYLVIISKSVQKQINQLPASIKTKVQDKIGSSGSAVETVLVDTFFFSYIR
jgi:hypothetical protein